MVSVCVAVPPASPEHLPLVVYTTFALLAVTETPVVGVVCDVIVTGTDCLPMLSEQPLTRPVENVMSTQGPTVSVIVPVLVSIAVSSQSHLTSTTAVPERPAAV